MKSLITEAEKHRMQVLAGIISEGKVDDSKSEKRFEVDKKSGKFKLFLGNTLVTECGFNVKPPDKWFDKKYLILHDMKTVKKYQRKGFAKFILKQIFNYVKDDLKLNIISLIVYKDNEPATKLYLKSGFEKYNNYDDFNDEDNSFMTLIKKL